MAPGFLDALSLARFAVFLRPQSSLFLPGYKGAAFRGGFGHVFKSIACPTHDRDCIHSRLGNPCVYSEVFDTPIPKHSAVMRKYPYGPLSGRHALGGRRTAARASLRQLADRPNPRSAPATGSLSATGPNLPAGWQRAPSARIPVPQLTRRETLDTKSCSHAFTTTRDRAGGMMPVDTLATQVRGITADMKEAYLSDDRPWVVGFSGGKDSTAVAQLVYYMLLLELPPEERRKKVHVLASDTRVELPTIVERVDSQLDLIRRAAQRDQLPIEVHKVFPALNDSFWVNLIGRGYPSPRPRFRWCTDRLKIRPVSRFILERVNEFGSAVIVLGSRISESSTRAQIMAAHHIEGQRFRPHAELPKAWVYTPIEALSTDEVWFYLLQAPSPWGGDNGRLAALYKRASGGECPLVIDTSTPSCGNSRFGCWVCTVVEKDRAMESLVEDGEQRYEPLLDLRDFLKEARDTPEARMNTRRNGRPAAADGKGPFTHRTRVEILKRLLIAEKQSGERLVDADELAAIAEVWAQEGQIRDLVFRVWRHVHEGVPMPDEKNDSSLSQENKLLEEVCHEQGVSFELLRRLRELEEEFGGLKRRHGLPDLMRETIKSNLGKSAE